MSILTNREQALLDKIWEYKSITQAAEELEITYATAKNKLQSIRGKLGSPNTANAIFKAYKKGLLK